jgi:hypothetical protein
VEVVLAYAALEESMVTAATFVVNPHIFKDLSYRKPVCEWPLPLLHSSKCHDRGVRKTSESADTVCERSGPPTSPKL